MKERGVWIKRLDVDMMRLWKEISVEREIRGQGKRREDYLS